MSDSRAIKTIYLNTEAFARGSLSGSSWQATSNLVFFRGTQSLIQCHLMLADGTTYFKPPAGCTWYAGFDTVFTAGHAELVTALNADFVAADWSDSDFANGKVCWRMDWTATALRDAMGDDSSKNGWMALWMTPAGEKPVLMGHWSVVVNNVAVDPTTATEQEGLVYVTTDMMSAYVKKHEDFASFAISSDGKHLYLYNSDDSFWYPLTVKSPGGTASVTPGTGVASVP